MAAVLAFSVTACGKDKEEETVPATAPVETESEAPSAPETESVPAETETETEEEAGSDNSKIEKKVDMRKGTVTAETPADDASEEDLIAFGKDAMKTAYFIGVVDKSVDKLLTELKPDGAWKGSVNDQGEICVYYEDDDFTASFIVGKDGMFQLAGVNAGEEHLEGQDAAYYLEEALGYEGK